MKTCLKCGIKIKNAEAISWDWRNGRTYLCPECYAVETDFYDEDEDNKDDEDN